MPVSRRRLCAVPKMFETEVHIQGQTWAGVAFDYALKSGDRLCLRGDNGSGKTSLLLGLAGLASHPDQSVFSCHSSAAMHFIGHRTGVQEALTIAEEWRFWHHILATEPPQTPCPIQEIADHVGLGVASERIIGTLSAGQKQKVALARLFLASRPVWLLDEPDSHLDHHSRAVLEGWMQQHCAEGGIIVDASHFPANFGTVFSLQGAG